MTKIKKIVFWIVTLGFLMFSLAFVSDRYTSIVCKDINVIILDSLENSFISGNDIVDVFTSKTENLIGQPLDFIDSKRIENKLLSHQSVISSEVYKSIDGTINIIIDQKNPILRIFTNNGKSFYIDETGKLMPLSKKYASHILVASGHINGDINSKNTKDIFSLNHPVLLDLYHIAEFIRNDRFWNSQIEQIYVKKDGDFELIPRVGAHIILLGTIENIDLKLRNLKAVYQQGFGNEKWTKYRNINLKYNNQVICTKR